MIAQLKALASLLSVLALLMFGTPPRVSEPPVRQIALSQKTAAKETATPAVKIASTTARTHDALKEIEHAVPPQKPTTSPLPFPPGKTATAPENAAPLDTKLPTQEAAPLAISGNPPALPPLTLPAETTNPALSNESQKPPLSLAELNKKTRAALVNILCTTKRGGLFEPLSGTGIIVDPRGVILTNAHIAQYFLLKDYTVQNFIDCLIRTGAPAIPRYRAKLLYLSPQWVSKNFQKISEREPEGTGRNDFAFLLITESTRPDVFPLPASFPHLPLDTDPHSVGNAHQVLIAAYPAGLISGVSVQRDLYPTSSIVERGQVYSFADSGPVLPDLMSVGGSPVAQQGSSGGAVVNVYGDVIGLLATAAIGTTTSATELNAVTANHIARSFKEQTGDVLEKLFEGDLAAAAESFNQNVAPELRKLLEGGLNKK